MSIVTELRVRYAETDQMGVVYYANYLVWFELGRGSLLKFAYRVIRASTARELQQVLAEGETVHIVCDASMQKCLMPERYAAPIRSAIRVMDRDEQGEMVEQE